jgi:hypothetical protein
VADPKQTTGLVAELISQAIRACSSGNRDGTAICVPEDAALSVLEHIERAGGMILLPVLKESLAGSSPGRKEETKVGLPCPTCAGTGSVRRSGRLNYASTVRSCMACGGSGKVVLNKRAGHDPRYPAI